MSIAQELSAFSGTILVPGDDGYAAAATVNSAVGEPAVVTRPSSDADVAGALAYARANGLVVSVRSGGHSASGYGTNTGGLVIDLGGLNDVDVLDGGLVRIGGGAVWGDVAQALQAHSLALTSGDTVSVGVGGLTLGGGIGWLVRQYGLALDSLVSATVVTAAGDILEASAVKNADLFWAIRGGGGNFGVVTRFTFQAHPLDGVVHGTINYDPEKLETVLKGWRDVMRAAPEQLNSTIMAMPAFGPEAPPALQVLVLWAGTDEAEGEAAIAPLLQIEGYLGRDIQPKPYADVLEEAEAPEGIVFVSDNGLADRFDDEVIESLATAFRSLDGALAMVRSMGGAFSRVAPDATAFAHRGSEVLIMLVAFMPPEAEAQGRPAFEQAWASVEPLTVGTYGNFQASGTEPTLARMYPPATRARLVEVKRAYDPGNLFNQNQNIAP